jgi:TonB family protein
MIEFLTYDLKVAALLAIFYMFYRLMLARETFHRVNRLVLLLTAVASFVLPLCVITMHETVTMQMPVIDDMVYDMPVAVPTVIEPSTPWWHTAAIVLFLVGMVVTLGHTLGSLFRIVSLISKSEKHPQTDGTIICVTGHADLAPFSWMCFIVMNRSDYEEQNAAILTHERGHIRFHHSWDLLLVDTLTALQWFNPAIWMLRSDLRSIHEYEADGAVLSQGINARQYQYLLITKAASIGGYSLANGISHSTLKNRINMMLHKKSNPVHLWKLLLLIPIVGMALAVNAETVTDYVYDEPELQQPIKKGKKAGTIKIGNQEIKVEESAAAQDEKPGEKFIAKGFVYDKDAGISSPIVGALVLIEGTKIGTVTDKEGNFKLEVSAGDKLAISYVGFETVILGVSKDYSTRSVVDSRYFVGLSKESGESKSNRAFDVIEEMPKFPGGQPALFQYLSMNVRYPKEAEDAGVQGRVIVTFVVEKDGSITGAKIFRSVDPALDAEALRVINGMPKWIPGKQNGEPVRVKYTVPVTFRIHGGPNIPADNEKHANALPETVVVGYGNETAQGLWTPGENAPCVIIDGKTVDGAKLKDIDPKTIESMDIIKGKSAVEKYGDKAKHGAILIITKKK